MFLRKKNCIASALRTGHGKLRVRAKAEKALL